MGFNLNGGVTDLPLACTSHVPSAPGDPFDSLAPSTTLPGSRLPIPVSNSKSPAPCSRRTSIDSIESGFTSGPSPDPSSRDNHFLYASASFYPFSSSPSPSSPSSSSSPLSNTADESQRAWTLDSKFPLGDPKMQTLIRSTSSIVSKPISPPPLPLPQHEPKETQLKILETVSEYEIIIHLPSFSPDGITVAQRSQDGSIHVVADQLEGKNSGHFERLIQLNHQTTPAHDHFSNEDDDDYYHHQLELPSKEVSSKFELDHLTIKVRKIGWSREYQRAVVCGNGSGLTGNKTYRLFL